MESLFCAPLRYLKDNWKVFAILASVAAILGYVHFMTIDFSSAACREARMETHRQILGATLDNPYRYRVLVPFINEFVIQILSVFTSHYKAFFISYLFSNCVTIFLLLSALYIYLKQWFSADQSLIGVLFTASSMVITFRRYCYQPWTFLDVALISIALLTMYKRRYGWLTLVTILSMLNRETGFFISLLFLFTHVDVKAFFKRASAKPWSALALFVFYFIISLATYGALRFWRGNVYHAESAFGFLGYYQTLGEVWTKNTESFNLRIAIIHLGLLFGVFWFFAIGGLKYASAFHKRVAYVVIPYFFVALIYLNWAEVRTLMFLYPILIPLALSFFYRK